MKITKQERIERERKKEKKGAKRKIKNKEKCQQWNGSEKELRPNKSKPQKLEDFDTAWATWRSNDDDDDGGGDDVSLFEHIIV